MTKPFWDLAGRWGIDDVAAEYYKYCTLITQNIFSTTAEAGPRIYLNSKSPRVFAIQILCTSPSCTENPVRPAPQVANGSPESKRH